MNFQSVVAGALASVFVVTSFWADAASANVRIVNDPGGEVAAYELQVQAGACNRRAHHHRPAMPVGMHAADRHRAAQSRQIAMASELCRAPPMSMNAFTGNIGSIATCPIRPCWRGDGLRRATESA
jgi:hypothetical protein